MKKVVPVLAILVLLASVARAEHPQILVSPADREAIQRKLKEAPWAVEAYTALKANADFYLARTHTDPQWLTSRLQMNRQTHYTTPLTKGERLWVAKAGHPCRRRALPGRGIGKGTLAYRRTSKMCGLSTIRTEKSG